MFFSSWRKTFIGGGETHVSSLDTQRLTTKQKGDLRNWSLQFKKIQMKDKNGKNKIHHGNQESVTLMEGKYGLIFFIL